MIYEPREIYEMCLALAKQSACKKLGYGAVLLHKDSSAQWTLVSQARNSPLLPLSDLCANECIRLKIKSGVNVMVGACAHAEELCIWAAMRDGARDLRHCELFVQGVTPDDTPVVLTTESFYCIRCASQMYLAGVRGVNVWGGGEWHFVSSEDALSRAKLYALETLEFVG